MTSGAGGLPCQAPAPHRAHLLVKVTVSANCIGHATPPHNAGLHTVHDQKLTQDNSFQKPPGC